MKYAAQSFRFLSREQRRWRFELIKVTCLWKRCMKISITSFASGKVLAPCVGVHCRGAAPEKRLAPCDRLVILKYGGRGDGAAAHRRTHLQPLKHKNEAVKATFGSLFTAGRRQTLAAVENSIVDFVKRWWKCPYRWIQAVSRSRMKDQRLRPGNLHGRDFLRVCCGWRVVANTYTTCTGQAGETESQSILKHERSLESFNAGVLPPLWRSFDYRNSSTVYARGLQTLARGPDPALLSIWPSPSNCFG